MGDTPSPTSRPVLGQRGSLTDKGALYGELQLMETNLFRGEKVQCARNRVNENSCLGPRPVGAAQEWGAGGSQRGHMQCTAPDGNCKLGNERERNRFCYKLVGR